MKRFFAFFVFGQFVVASVAIAAPVTFTSSDLFSGTTSTVDGVTLEASSSDGTVSTLSFGGAEGTYIGGTDDSGTYELSFSESIDSIQFEFVGLSAVDGLEPAESIFDFAVGSGSVAIDYTDISGDTFSDGSTVSTTGVEGAGIVGYSGASFSSFFFSHSQNPILGGFIITEVTVNTVSAVPLPASALLLLGGFAGLVGVRRLKKAEHSRI